MKHILFVLVAVALTSCATPTTMSPQGSSAEIDKEASLQKELALKRSLEEDARVRNIAFPISKANASLCEDTHYELGMTVWNHESISREYQDVAHEVYGVGSDLQVRNVYKNTPASANGIKAGDIILAIDEQEIPAGRNAMKTMATILDKADQQIAMTIVRNGKEIDKTITRAETCGYGVIYDSENSSVNAYADGNNIIIPRGMLRFVDSDKELALVIAHELGHNAMGHMDKKRTNAMGAGLGGFALDILAAAAGVNTGGAFTDAAARAGAGAYSVEFEQEADYVGMYFLARAGYSTSGVANFWRRMSSELNDSNINERSTHPATAERFVAIEKAHAEIQAKKSTGKKLVPEIDLEKQERSNMKYEEPQGYNN